MDRNFYYHILPLIFIFLLPSILLSQLSPSWGLARDILGGHTFFVGPKAGIDISSIDNISETLISEAYPPESYNTFISKVESRSMGFFVRYGFVERDPAFNETYWYNNLSGVFDIQFARQNYLFDYSDDELSYQLDLNRKSIDLSLSGRYALGFRNKEDKFLLDLLQSLFVEFGVTRSINQDLNQGIKFSSLVPDLDASQNNFLNSYIQDNLNDVLVFDNDWYVHPGLGFAFSFPKNYGNIGIEASGKYYWGLQDAISTLENGYSFSNPQNQVEGWKIHVALGILLNRTGKK